MIYFVLNDLRGPAGIDFDACLHLHVLILDLDGFIAFTRTWVAKKRQTSFLCIVDTVLFDDLGIEHHGICWSSSAFIVKGNDTLLDSNHIGCHTDTAFLVRHQRIKQILCDLQIFFCCELQLPCKEYRIVHKFSYHN